MHKAILSFVITFMLAGRCCAAGVIQNLDQLVVLSPNSQHALDADPVLAHLWVAAKLHSKKLGQMLEAERLAKSVGLSYSPAGALGTSYADLNMSLTDPTEPEYKAIPSIAMDANFGARLAASAHSIVGSTIGPQSTEPPQTAADVALEEMKAALRECQRFPQIVSGLRGRLADLPPEATAEREWIEHQIPYSMRQWQAAYDTLVSFCGPEAVLNEKIFAPLQEAAR